MGIQNSIHEEMVKPGIRDISEVINKDEFTDFLVGETVNGPLWSRDYLKKSRGETCSSLGKEVNGVDLTIVGHCPTYKPYHDDIYHNELLDLPKYLKRGCKPPGGHCVLVGCEDHNGPHIAFTDVGLTRAFSQIGDGKTPNLRRIEILRLEHAEAGGGAADGRPGRGRADTALSAPWSHRIRCAAACTRSARLHTGSRGAARRGLAPVRRRQRRRV